MKPKGVLVLKKFQILCQKLPVENRYPELMYKRYCLHPPGYLFQRHLYFVEGASLPLEARKEFLAEINLLRFHYRYILSAINFTEIEALCVDGPFHFSSVREGTLTFGHLGDMETNDVLDCFVFSLCFQLFNLA